MRPLQGQDSGSIPLASTNLAAPTPLTLADTRTTTRNGFVLKQNTVERLVVHGAYGEMVDIEDCESSEETRAGSSPVMRPIHILR